MTEPRRGWRPILAGADADSTRAVALAIAARLRDSRSLARALEAAPRQSALPEDAAWRAVELARGHPGLAVTFAQFGACDPDGGWAEDARDQLRQGVDALRRDRDVQTGLFSGLTGLAFAADLVDRAAHAKLLSTLDGLIVRRSEPILKRIDGSASGVAEYDLDLVSGLTGIGAYLMAREHGEALRPILDCLAGLLGRSDEVPVWHAPPELLPDDERAGCPRGRLNCGLAHGMPGPLVLLALAKAAGVDEPRLGEAVEQASAWLVAQAFEDEWGINWPAFVRVGSDRPEPPARAAWCYGAPGVARALWLAGAALDDARLRDIAVAALEGVHRRPPAARRIDAPTFCHGRAGLLQITLRMANDSGSQALRDAGEQLALDLARAFRPERILGYRDLDRAGRPVDQAGLLYGAAGIALVLLAATTPVPPRWDRMFLLA